MYNHKKVVVFSRSTYLRYFSNAKYIMKKNLRIFKVGVSLQIFINGLMGVSVKYGRYIQPEY